MKRIIGILLIIFGVGIIVYPYLNAEIDKTKINKNISEWDTEKSKYENNKSYINKGNINSAKKNCNNLNEKINRDNSIDINGKEIIGKIVILKTGEQIPIIMGATAKNLKEGATLYNNGIYPGDKGTAVILGHRETTFGFLENIKIGDEIEIETLNNICRFRLEKTYIVNPDDPIILKQEGYSGVTLDTCYPFHYFGNAPKRFIAKFKLIKKELNY